MDATHLVLLQKLSEGGRFNVLHSTARSLIAEGLAREEFGRLVITETGRLALRARRSLYVIDDHVGDLNFACHLSGDPMSNPQAEPFELLPEAPMPLPAPPEPLLEPTDDRKQLALRAAGVASGKTGVWVDEQWLMEFITALDAG
ncbi:MAG: hypothetical protein EHM67_05735 [Hyphomicrobiaceae bacterium]|nr:MAG: hypothetical protein EHM67_05735 [Hyphomicrobiaceae bacterium]